MKYMLSKMGMGKDGAILFGPFHGVHALQHATNTLLFLVRIRGDFEQHV